MVFDAPTERIILGVERCADPIKLKITTGHRRTRRVALGASEPGPTRYLDIRLDERASGATIAGSDGCVVSFVGYERVG